MTKDLNVLYQRDLEKVIEEIEAYPSEEALWKTAGDIKNPPGNLALHMAGNLLHYVGALLASSNYVRDREKEFSARDIPRSELLAELRKAKKIIDETLPSIQTEHLGQPFPGKIPFEMTMGQFLLHLYGHLNYHLGQINYHRRLTED